MSKGFVRGNDRGLRRWKEVISKPTPRLKVGVFGDAAAARAEGVDMTIGDLANTHEFGLGNVPERSMIRAYVDANAARIQEMVKRVTAAVVAGRMTPEAGLNLIGLQVVGEIQQRMSAGIAPPLSPAYLRRKLRIHPGATNPLIATGQLRSSITHQVVSADGTPIAPAGPTGGGGGKAEPKAKRGPKRTLKSDVKSFRKEVKRRLRLAKPHARALRRIAKKRLRGANREVKRRLRLARQVIREHYG